MIGYMQDANKANFKMVPKLCICLLVDFVFVLHFESCILVMKQVASEIKLLHLF